MSILTYFLVTALFNFSGPDAAKRQHYVTVSIREDSPVSEADFDSWATTGSTAAQVEDDVEDIVGDNCVPEPGITTCLTPEDRDCVCCLALTRAPDEPVGTIPESILPDIDVTDSKIENVVAEFVNSSNAIFYIIDTISGDVVIDGHHYFGIIRGLHVKAQRAIFLATIEGIQPGEGGTLDLPVTMFHEFGHLQGLSDSTIYGSVMHGSKSPGEPASYFGNVQCEAMGNPGSSAPLWTTIDLSDQTCSFSPEEAPREFAAIEQDAGVTDRDAATTSSGTDPSGEDGGGCSVVHPGRPRHAGFASFVALLSLMAVHTRRRRSNFTCGRSLCMRTQCTALRVTLLFGLTALAGCNVQSTVDRIAQEVPDFDIVEDVGVECDDTDHDGVCDSDDCNDHAAEIYPGAVEVCNGIDDNCNSMADEGFDVGGDCSVELETCVAEGSWQCNSSGIAVCVADGRYTEWCNSIDDDCDGQVDDNTRDSGAVCETGQPGICAIGHYVCTEGFLDCFTTTAPGDVEETCNGLDDDCDGEVDEDGVGGLLATSCYGGSPGTMGVGACSGGTSTCFQGAPGPCIGQVVPRREICDQLDNDCNGETDEGLSCGCTPEATQDCYTGPVGTEDVGNCHGGSQTCTIGGTWGTCLDDVPPAAERCTPPAGGAADEDCDGEVDEELLFGDLVVELGDSCSLGIGGCRAQGVFACADDGTVYCTAEPSIPLPETCNGIDDNCNGQTDESPIGSNCTVGVGACARNGVEVCNGEALECNVDAGAPAIETCNDIDDDCDGVVDNVFLEGEEHVGGGDCTSGLGVCANPGHWECDDDGFIRCSAIPDGPSPEACDGLDNDCDGEVDDGLGLGNECSGIGACGDGVYECSALHTVVCSTLPGGSDFDEETHTELMHCDGLDNDCDGDVDEVYYGMYGIGTPCTGWCGDGGHPGGIVECAHVDSIDYPGTQCSTAQFGSDVAISDETCDNIDDDCNFIIDDAFEDEKGDPCSVGTGGCAVSGVMVCNEGHDGTVCDADPGSPAPEVCNGLDDDCDGIIDNAVSGMGGGCDGADADFCNEGVTSCVAGDVVCSDLSGDNVELCNGVDDDCNPATVDGSGAMLGVACDGEDTDLCTEGVTSCVAGSVACSDSTGNSIETCNGLDDDCDGDTDEDAIGDPLTQSCYSGAPGTESHAPCHAGTKTCAAGVFAGACVGEVVPTGEVCGNDIDDDCDGTADTPDPEGCTAP